MSQPPIELRKPSLRARIANFIARIALHRLWKINPSIKAVRHRISQVDKRIGAYSPKARVTEVNANGVPCQWLQWEETPVECTLFYIHGGGFSVHMPETYSAFCSDLAKRLRARVLMVDYRLSPEHPFPAAPDDCLTAYRWLLSQEGVTPESLLLAGDSAGGNLSLVTLLQAKQANLPLPAAAWLISPAVDCDWSRQDMERAAYKDPMFTAMATAFMEPYFAEHDRNDYRISPLFGNLEDLPPLLVECGQNEMLWKHTVWLEHRAQVAKVKIVENQWPGMMHCFQLMPFIPEAGIARRQACRFLRAHLPDRV